MRKLTFHKCWNCKRWGWYVTNPYCECGVNVLERVRDMAAITIDIDEIIRFFMEFRGKGD